MKKNLLFMLALVAACVLPIKSWAVQVTFKVMYKNSVFSISGGSPGIYVYKGGEQINQSTSLYSGTCTCELDDSYAGQTVSYRSTLGHEGKFKVANGAEVLLNCQKVTVTTKDSKGVALPNQNVYIYDATGRTNYAYTDYEGAGTIYLASGGEFSYEWESQSQSGSFTLSSDYALNLVAGGGGGEVSTKYTLKAIARYGDFPVSSDSYVSYYLYRYGDKNSSIASVGSYGTKVDAGSYWIRDNLGVFSNKIDVKSDMTAYLDYYKVTFVSKTGTTPNVGQTITISYNGNESYYGNTKTVTTDSKGVAIAYLMPGEYAYAIAGGQTKFTVKEEDQTLNVNTSRATISLKCDDMSAISGQVFEWGTMSSNGYYSYSTVSQSDGKVVVTTMPGSYKLRINRAAVVDINVAEGENNVSIQLYSVMFTTNNSNVKTVYLESLTCAFDTKYYLPAGDYSYGASTSTYSQATFTLSGNKTIALNYATLTVNVKDTKGNPVSGVYFTNLLGGKSTDANGQASWDLLQGTYTVYPESFYNLAQSVELNGDKSVTFTIPAYVTFNILDNGQSLTSKTLYLYTESGNSVPVTVINGVATARIEPGKTYHLTGCQGSAVITEGCTLSIGTLSISCEGMGLAFPMENWEAVSTYSVIVGSTVRLTAIPVSDDKFRYWTINGTENSSPVIDLKLTAVNTIAKAVFGGTIVSAVKAMNSGLAFDIDDNYINLGEDVVGTAKIYTSDGRLVKEIGVVGGQIGIYDLPEGTYILSFKDASGVKNNRFSKK